MNDNAMNDNAMNDDARSANAMSANAMSANAMNASATNDNDTLRVGATDLVVRPIQLDDVARLERMFDRLSPDTVYRRFFSPLPKPPRRALLWLVSVDHDRREALVALDGDEIVAVARYDGKPETGEAEVAFTVEDAWQHRSIGKRLARRLAARALERGYDRFVATMLPDNKAALGLLHKLSDDVSVRFADGGYAATIPLARAG
jgi:RimJ/RimL family protein N-acetyltransferase